MEENNKYVKSIMIKAFIFLAVMILASLFLFEDPMPIVLGLVLGGGLSIVFFRLIYLNILIAIGKTKEKARTHMTVSYIVRYIIYGLVMTIAAKSDAFNLYATLVGLLSIKIVMYIDNLIALLTSRKEGKNGH